MPKNSSEYRLKFHTVGGEVRLANHADWEGVEYLETSTSSARITLQTAPVALDFGDFAGAIFLREHPCIHQTLRDGGRHEVVAVRDSRTNFVVGNFGTGNFEILLDAADAVTFSEPAAFQEVAGKPREYEVANCDVTYAAAELPQPVEVLIPDILGDKLWEVGEEVVLLPGMAGTLSKRSDHGYGLRVKSTKESWISTHFRIVRDETNQSWVSSPTSLSVTKAGGTLITITPKVTECRWPSSP